MGALKCRGLEIAQGGDWQEHTIEVEEKIRFFGGATFFKTERLDVENPNPGQRPGQLHYQDNKGNKYLYDPQTKSFPGAPKSVNQLLKESRFSQAVDKGMSKYLGVSHD